MDDKRTRGPSYQIFTASGYLASALEGLSYVRRSMDRVTAKLTLCLGIFSGASLSAAWFSARPGDYVGAVSLGAATCALVLLVLRFDRAFVRQNRRHSDRPADAAAQS